MCEELLVCVGMRGGEVSDGHTSHTSEAPQSQQNKPDVYISLALDPTLAQPGRVNLHADKINPIRYPRTFHLHDIDNSLIQGKKAELQKLLKASLAHSAPRTRHTEDIE